MILAAAVNTANLADMEPAELTQLNRRSPGRIVAVAHRL